MVSATIFDCSHSPGSLGWVDESNRNFLSKERALAEGLAREGHHVASNREGPKLGKQGDANVCGQATEFKRIEPGGTAEPENRVRNILGRSMGQGTHVIIDTTADRRVTPEKADEGVRKFLALEASQRAEGKLEGAEKLGIRVIGENFDLAYDQSRLTQIRQEQAQDRSRQAGEDSIDQPRERDAQEPTSDQHRDGETPATAPEANQARVQNRFAIKGSKERSGEDDRAVNRFRIAKGDDTSPRRRGPAK